MRPVTPFALATAALSDAVALGETPVTNGAHDASFKTSADVRGDNTVGSADPVDLLANVFAKRGPAPDPRAATHSNQYPGERTFPCFTQRPSVWSRPAL